VSARFFRAFLPVVRSHLGARPVEELLRDLGVGRADVEDETNWFALDFCEAFCERLVQRTGGTQILVDGGRAAFTPRAFGFLYPFIRAFGSAELLYRKIVELLPMANKVGRMRLVELAPGRAVIEYTAVQGGPRERTPLICIARAAQLASVPTVFGLPEARLVERECQARGGERCLYEMTWLPARRSTGLFVGALSGVGVALLAVPALGASGTAATALSGGAILLGAALGALADSRREIVRRGAYLAEQNAALAVSADATERRFAEVQEAKREVDRKVEERTAELHDALDKLQAASRAKSDFFANVSHELRTPLTLILAPLESLLSSPEKATTDVLLTVHRNAVRLLRLINELLDLAKIDAGGMRIRPVPNDLAGLVRQIALPFGPLAADRGIRLEVEGAADLPPVPVDPDRIDIAVSNLVANALRFTPAGGRVGVRVFRDGDDACVEVSDTGPGIAPDDQARVFARFAQASTGPRRAGGTGIGLALVHEIATLHGGRASLSSELGAGATFSVRLPLDAARIPAASLDRRQVDVPVAQVRRATDVDPWTSLAGAAGALAELQAETVPAPRDTPSAPPPLPVDAPTVLVAEDHAELRAFVTRALGRHCRVVEAADGQEALEAALRSPPDLVLSDVMMPRMDGLTLCRTLKTEPATRRIPVILLTAKTGVDRILEGFEAGADDYLGKPFNDRELLARVDVHLRLRALLEEVGRQERLATLGTVAAGVAHEVRNPLGAMQAIFPRLRATLKEAERLDGRTDEALLVAQDSLGRIERVTRDLLDLARVDREPHARWDPNEAVAAAVRLLGARGAAAKVELALGPVAPVQGRPAELNQIVLNVIDNALKAAGAEGRVVVSTRIEGGELRLTVADDGPGIPPEVRARVFTPFFTTRVGGEGTGLGLAIARRIVQDHLGRIEVDCPPEGGTRIEVVLPTVPKGEVAYNEQRA